MIVLSIDSFFSLISSSWSMCIISRTRFLFERLIFSFNCKTSLYLKTLKYLVNFRVLGLISPMSDSSQSQLILTQLGLNLILVTADYINNINIGNDHVFIMVLKFGLHLFEPAILDLHMMLT